MWRRITNAQSYSSDLCLSTSPRVTYMPLGLAAGTTLLSVGGGRHRHRHRHTLNAMKWAALPRERETKGARLIQCQKTAVAERVEVSDSAPKWARNMEHAIMIRTERKAGLKGTGAAHRWGGPRRGPTTGREGPAGDPHRTHTDTKQSRNGHTTHHLQMR